MPGANGPTVLVFTSVNLMTSPNCPGFYVFLSKSLFQNLTLSFFSVKGCYLIVAVIGLFIAKPCWTFIIACEPSTFRDMSFPPFDYAVVYLGWFNLANLGSEDIFFLRNASAILMNFLSCKSFGSKGAFKFVFLFLVKYLYYVSTLSACCNSS